SGWTPLHEACIFGHFDVAKCLLEAQANVNAKGLGHITPIYDAVKAGHLECDKLLLKFGANPHLVTENGKTAFDETVDEKFLNLLSLFNFKRTLRGPYKCNLNEVVMFCKRGATGVDSGCHPLALPDWHPTLQEKCQNFPKNTRKESCTAGLSKRSATALHKETTNNNPGNIVAAEYKDNETDENETNLHKGKEPAVQNDYTFIEHEKKSKHYCGKRKTSHIHKSIENLTLSGPQKTLDDPLENKGLEIFKKYETEMQQTTSQPQEVMASTKYKTHDTSSMECDELIISNCAEHAITVYLESSVDSSMCHLSLDSAPNGNFVHMQDASFSSNQVSPKYQPKNSTSPNQMFSSTAPNEPCSVLNKDSSNTSDYNSVTNLHDLCNKDSSGIAQNLSCENHSCSRPFKNYSISPYKNSSVSLDKCASKILLNNPSTHRNVNSYPISPINTVSNSLRKVYSISPHKKSSNILHCVSQANLSKDFSSAIHKSLSNTPPDSSFCSLPNSSFSMAHNNSCNTLINSPSAVLPRSSTSTPLKTSSNILTNISSSIPLKISSNILTNISSSTPLKLSSIIPQHFYPENISACSVNTTPKSCPFTLAKDSSISPIKGCSQNEAYANSHVNPLNTSKDVALNTAESSPRPTKDTFRVQQKDVPTNCHHLNAAEKSNTAEIKFTDIYFTSEDFFNEFSFVLENTNFSSDICFSEYMLESACIRNDESNSNSKSVTENVKDQSQNNFICTMDNVTKCAQKNPSLMCRCSKDAQCEHSYTKKNSVRNHTLLDNFQTGSTSERSNDTECLVTPEDVADLSDRDVSPVILNINEETISQSQVSSKTFGDNDPELSREKGANKKQPLLQALSFTIGIRHRENIWSFVKYTNINLKDNTPVSIRSRHRICRVENTLMQLIEKRHPFQTNHTSEA
ncbi:ankyrin repeat domain-containing 31, partial [Pelobates cultripes]